MNQQSARRIPCWGLFKDTPEGKIWFLSSWVDNIFNNPSLINLGITTKQCILHTKYFWIIKGEETIERNNDQREDRLCKMMCILK